MTGPIRLLLAEDHGLVRAGLRALLERLPKVEVVGEAKDAEEAVRHAQDLRPDVVLLDVGTPGAGGLAATRRIASLRPAPKVLALSIDPAREVVRQALAAGASGYLPKSADREELAMAVAAVARGEAWLSPTVAKSVIDDLPRAADGEIPRPPPAPDLTPRQREVLRCIAEGASSKEIAKRLGLSVKTVEAHRSQIMARLGVHNVAGLVRYALRSGLVQESGWGPTTPPASPPRAR